MVMGWDGRRPVAWPPYPHSQKLGTQKLQLWVWREALDADVSACESECECVLTCGSLSYTWS
jgi:hypothetical protein